MAHPRSEEGPGITRIDAQNFVKDVPRVRKCVPKWRSTPNHFVMGFIKKLWTIYVEMGVSESVGSDVPNLMMDVPNFVKDVRNFVNDVPRVQKCFPKWGSTPNHFVMGL